MKNMKMIPHTPTKKVAILFNHFAATFNNESLLFL